MLKVKSHQEVEA